MSNKYLRPKPDLFVLKFVLHGNANSPDADPVRAFLFVSEQIHFQFGEYLMFHYHAAYNMLEIANQGANCGGISGDLDMCSIEREISPSIHFTWARTHLPDGYSSQ